MKTSTIETIIKYLIGAAFIMPLLVVTSKFIFPFIVPKILFFRILTVVMLVGYLGLLITNRAMYKIRLNFINIAVLLFFASFAVSTFVGLDWYRSFWDNHERMLGLFTITHFIIYYFVATTVIKEWKDWQWLLRFFLMAGSVVMFIGVVQKFINPDLLMNRGSGRVSATLGNSIYYSGYGLFLFSLGAYLAIKEKQKYWQIFSVIGAALGFLGIFLGGTRGTLVGLIGALGLASFLYAIYLKENPRVKKICVGLVIFGVIGGGLLLAFKQTSFVKGIPGVGRLANTSLTTGSAGTRIMAWGVAIDSWKEKPVFGWGPNNFYYAFNKHYRAEFLEHGYGETWFDNAHNILMNTLSVQGIFGVITYIGIFLVAGSMLFVSFRKGEIDIHLFVIGNAFLLGHFLHNIFVFENPTSYLYFLFFLAFIGQRTSQKIPVVQGAKSVSVGPLAFISAVALIFILVTNVNVARANTATLQALRAVHKGDPAALDLYEKAKSFGSPHIDDIRADFGRTVLQTMGPILQSGKVDLAEELFAKVYEDTKENSKFRPRDIRINLLQAQLAQVGLQQTGNIVFMEEAREALRSAHDQSPERQQVIYALASAEFQLKNPEEAIRLLEQSIEDDPKIEEGWWRLVVTYRENGDLEKAQEVAKEFLERDDIKKTDRGIQIAEEVLNSVEPAVEVEYEEANN